MRIESVEIRNYRTFDQCEVSFPDYYTALSGKNNAGKSNLLRVIRAFFFDAETYDPITGETTEVNHKADYPLWKKKDEKKENICFRLKLRIHKERDQGLYKFVQTFLNSTCEEEEMTLELGMDFSCARSELQYSLKYQSTAIDDYFKVQEIHKKIRNSNAFIFHNSTQPKSRYAHRSGPGALFGSISPEDREKIKESKDTLYRRLNTIAAKHKNEISDLLGRLEDQYEVSIAVPTFEFESFPFTLSLGDKKEDVPLEDWGSGTQNRTHILIALLRAKKIRELASDSDKITPIIVIEEPESFLHPSAQAEFGRVLRDLSREFEVQVIATTHSPHLLSVGRPDANILLSRRTERSRTFESYVEDTSGDNWMQPFALALGVTSEAFSAWKPIIFASSNEILLVEGEIDKDYFEHLKQDCHGPDKLLLHGEIFPYGGEGFFSHDVMLKFIIQRFGRVFITYDLDCEIRLRRRFESLGLKPGDDYFPVGLPQMGKRNVEGLLPSRITAEVASNHPDIIVLATSGDEGNKGAQQKLKRLKQEHFFNTALPLSPEYAEFYELVRSINKAIKRKRRL